MGDRITTLRTTVERLRKRRQDALWQLKLTINGLRDLMIMRWGKVPSVMRRDDVRALWRAIAGRGKVPAIYRGVYQAVVAALGKGAAPLAKTVADRAVKLIRMKVGKLRSRADYSRLYRALDAVEVRIGKDIIRTVETETVREVNRQVWAGRADHVRMIWDATLDQRVCATCRGKHGQVVDSIADIPPAHPHCRCVIVEAPILHPTKVEWGKGRKVGPLKGSSVWV